MFFTVILIFCLALFIDGATDCANSVTGAVSSGTMTLRGASRMSAVLSFFGCIVFCLFFPSVAENTVSAVSFPEEKALLCISVSLFAVALWSFIAWLMALPTSEGHAIISASAGAAAALGGTVNVPRVLFLLFSVIPAALISAFFAWAGAKITEKAMPGCNFKTPIIIFAAVASLFHGAQDGQKFITLALSSGAVPEGKMVPFLLLISFSMGIGTIFGRRIIEKMGGEMAVADSRAALAADGAGAAALALFTLLGIPASTTHVRMTALFGAARAMKNKTDTSSFLLLICAWGATFPVSFLLAFLLSKLSIVMFL
ncbi:MAG: inorganic phosphate transporter [Clostridia bacterium]|nr:inorganic phosphate transporter [Clostridia bacterium]